MRCLQLMRPQLPRGLNKKGMVNKLILSLGYSTLWIPETTGKNPMVLSSWLLSNTKELNIATGIANIYHIHLFYLKSTYQRRIKF